MNAETRTLARRLLVAAVAAALLGAAGGMARAQWHWRPKSGWTEAPPKAALEEPTPPRFLPRYREEVTAGEIGTPQNAYYLAYLMYEADDFSRAARLFKRVAEDWADDPAWAARARFMRGEAYFQGQSYYKAYTVFDAFLKDYPGGRNYRLALQREFEIGVAFLRGRRRRWLGLPVVSGEKTGLEVLRHVREHDPRGPLTDDCLALSADCRFRTEAYDEAELDYQMLVKDHPTSPFAAQAMYRIACCRLFRHTGDDYDVGLLRGAAQAFERFLRAYPKADQARQAAFYLERTLDRLARAILDTGRFYQKRGRDRAALTYYRRVVKEYPGTGAAADAERLIRGLSGEPEPPSEEEDTGEPDDTP